MLALAASAAAVFGQAPPQPGDAPATAAQNQPLEAAESEPELPPELAGQLRDLRRQHNIPVLAVALYRDGAQTFHVLGAQPDTPLRWGSITKSVTALTVLALAERQLINLNDPLYEYVDPGYWQNPWRQSSPVRIRQLLELTAGFPDLSGLEFNHAEPVSLAQALALNPQHRVTRWPPGLQHVYSNLTPGLSQLLIETVSGKSYAASSRELILAPLGMHRAGFEPDPELPGGFRADGSTPIPYWHMTFPAYGALNASTVELAALQQHLMRGTRAPQTRRALYNATTTLASQRGLSFGYGAGLYTRVRNGLVWHTHGGDADGYRSRLAFIQGQPRGYVANINTDNPGALRQLEKLLEAELSKGLPRPPAPPATRVPAQHLSLLGGTYYPTGSRFGVEAWRAGSRKTIQVQAHASHLSVQRRQGSTHLLPVSANLYRRQNDPVATVAFVHRGNQLYLQGELGNYVRLPDCPDFMLGIPGCADQAAPAAQ